MHTAQPHKAQKANYAPPQIEMIQISCMDILTASENGDANQGLWDPQLLEAAQKGERL